MTHPDKRETGLFARFTSSPWSVLAIVALALVLRLVNLGGRPVWYDEAFAILYAEKPLATMFYGTITQVGGVAADVHPLFFYSMLHVWMRVVGQSPLAVRALSALLGTATVAMVYSLACRLFDRRTALVAAIIAAIAPFPIYYSQEARMYALLGFVAIVMTYFFVRAWTGESILSLSKDAGLAESHPSINSGCLPVPLLERLRSGNWIAFSIFGAITLYAHNLGFAFLAGLDFWVLWTWLRSSAPRWRNLRPVLLSHLLIIGLFAPWLVMVPSQFNKIQQAYWVEQPGLTQLIQTILIFHFAYDNQSLPRWLLPPALFVSLLILAVVTFELVRHRTSNLRLPTPYSWPKLRATALLPTPYSLLLSLTLIPILLTFLVSQFRPVYVTRALLPSALAYYMLAASMLVVGAVPKPVKWGLLLPSAAIIAVSLVNHYGYAQFPRPPFDQVVAYLRVHSQPADVIVHSNKLTFFPSYYYDRSLPQVFIADEPGSPTDTLAYPTQEALGLFATADIATATQGHERVWFVIFRRAIDEYRAAGYPDHPQRVWLEQRYTLAAVISFNDLDVYEYQSGPPPAAFLQRDTGR